MASNITSSPVTEEPKTQNEPERMLMPEKLLMAAIYGNETDLNKFLGLEYDNEQDPPPHTKVFVEDDTPMELSDCLRSITGMKDTILHILSANGHKKHVPTICGKDKSLLKACNARSETPFHHAARFGHKNNISELIRCAKLEFDKEELEELLRQKNFFGETALHEAARHGHTDVVSTLMEEDVELAGLVNKDCASPLYLATVRGSLEMVKKMVAKMPKQRPITSEFYSGPKKQTALHAAVLHSPELTEEVLQLYPKQLGEETRKILHLVVLTGNCKIAELLLDKDRSLAYVKDSDGSFPVHTAVRMGHVRVFSLLLRRCLDSAQLLDGNGRNFLHIAIKAKRYGIIDEFLEDLGDELTISYWKEMFSKMLKSMDNNGNTPIHFAAQFGRIKSLNSFSKDMELDLLTLQNQEGLTAKDILLIRNRKCETTQGKYNFEEKYIRCERNHFSAAWLQDYSKDNMSETELTRGAKKDHIPTSAKLEYIPTDAKQDHIPTNFKQDHILTDAKQDHIPTDFKQDHILTDAKQDHIPTDAKHDHIPTTDSTGHNKSSESLMTRAQLVGLGSVLIATVSFAAAFTLPGGTNQDTGTPILGRKYLFKAFILADFSAFFLSFISTMLLIRSSINQNPDRMKLDVDRSLRTFRYATKCMVMALALDLYLVLAPVGNTAKIIIVFSFLLILNDQKISRNKPTAEQLFIKKLLSRKQEPKMKLVRKLLSTYLSVYILFPLFFIFVFALI